jgi:poly(3-hydroxybutyrate) depolymerase
VAARGVVCAVFGALVVGCSSSGTDGGIDASMESAVEAAVDSGPADTGPVCDSGTVMGGPMVPTPQNVSINGVSRMYILSVPRSAINAMSAGCGGALVIGLHGAGDTATNFLNATGLEATANANGFVLAGPQALSGAWILSPPQWTSGDGRPTSLWNDIALVLQIVADVEGSYRIDPAQIFVVGLSRGGYFTGILATASNNPQATGGPYSSPFAAYAISAGADAYNGTVDFSMSSPKNPIWMIHGTNDMQVPFSAGQQFANELMNAGWPVTFTPVPNAPHNWLWQSQYGHSNDELWHWFETQAGH